MWIQKCLSSRLYSCLHAGTGNSSEECGPRVEVQIELFDVVACGKWESVEAVQTERP